MISWVFDLSLCRIRSIILCEIDFTLILQNISGVIQYFWHTICYINNMTIQEINQTYSRIIGSLDRKELKNAFDAIQSLIAGAKLYAFQDKLNELQETYQYMLRYRVDGLQDPMQNKIYRNIQASAYELSDLLKQKALAIDSPLTFYAKRRTMQLHPVLNYAQLHEQLIESHRNGQRKMFDDLTDVLFNKIWTSSFLTQDESAEIQQILSDKELPYTVGGQIISALLLGSQEAFDKEKTLLLLEAANLSDDEIRIRAMIVLLIVLFKYRKRTELYPQLATRLESLAENKGFVETIRTITLRFILARETEKIMYKLQNEIIPEMMKLSPKLSNKLNIKDISPEQLSEEMNPEWESLFADKQLGKKMEEFSELQQEGADIMHSTFVHLKHFPFFRDTAHWFLPFTADHSDFGNRFLNENNTEQQMLDSMTIAAFMCNSDKFSFYFSMMQLPEDARKMMVNQFDSQISDMIQQNKEELINKRGKAETIIGQYIQDLYRFYKLYPGHGDFEDIFNLSLDFHNLEILKPYISDYETLTMIAEYYLRKNYFKDALVIFNQFVAANHVTDILYQKIGYCKQMTGELEEALEYYLRADMLNTESKWVIRRIAGCYRSLKQPEKALEYYRRYDLLNPDNLSIAISIGHCYLELKDYTEALKYFFKVDYLDSKSNKAWRPIAWCSFLTGKYDQARNYYKKILENNPNIQDLLNAGHTEWALQNQKGALKYYQQAIQLEDGNFLKFLEQFSQDVPDLLIAGIDKNEVALMLDQLRYLLAGYLNV